MKNESTFYCNRCKEDETLCNCADPHWTAYTFPVIHDLDCGCLFCQEPIEELFL